MILFRNNVSWVGRKNILLIVLIMSFSCMACNSDDDVIRTVTNIEGTVWYDSDSRLWFIQVPTSMDSADLYYVEKFDENYQEQGLRVLFSGDLYPFKTNHLRPDGYAEYLIDFKMIKKATQQ